jgi:hypothetical protein
MVHCLHGFINYIDIKGNCRHLQKFTCKGTLQAGVYLSEALPLLLPHIPPFTLHTCILIHTGKGGVELTREKVRGQQFTKLGQKYQDV